MHLEKFKQEAKKLRLQLGNYKREFTSRDVAFLKLRNAVASQEFTLSQLKRYLAEQNMRMVYKLVGVAVPKPIAEKLKSEGADITDFFPVKNNQKPPPPVYAGVLGLLEGKSPATDEELKRPALKKLAAKKDEEEAA